MGRFCGGHPPLIRGERRKAGHLALRSPLCDSAEAVFSKLCRFTAMIRLMVTTRPFLKNAKPSTCGFVIWNSGVVESPRFIDVNRHSFEMTLNRYQAYSLAKAAIAPLEAVKRHVPHWPVLRLYGAMGLVGRVGVGPW